MSTFDIIVILAGVFLGSVIRASHLSAALGMSLIFPFCLGLNSNAALFAMVAVYCGGKIGRGVSAVFGAIFAALFVALLIPPMSSFASSLNSSEVLALCVFVVLSLALACEKKYVFHAFTSLAGGLLLPTVGIEISTGVQRYTFGMTELQGGIDFIVVAIGLCCLGEIFDLVSRGWRIRFRIEEETPHGVESSGSARSIGELAPAISLGIPCESETAILVALFSFYGMTAPSGTFTFWAVPVVICILARAICSNILVEPAVRAVNKSRFAEFFNPVALYPIFVTVAFCGVYSLHYRIFDMLSLIFFGFLGFFMKRYSFSIPLFLVGFALSSRMEQAFRGAYVWTWLNIALYALTAIVIWHTLKRWRLQDKPLECRE